jgi:hypothetical protein
VLFILFVGAFFFFFFSLTSPTPSLLNSALHFFLPQFFGNCLGYSRGRAAGDSFFGRKRERAEGDSVVCNYRERGRRDLEERKRVETENIFSGKMCFRKLRK